MALVEFDYDLFVIGAGSGGVRAARVAAGLGARVAIAEDLYLGGTCVNVGCVPKKLYVYASEFGRAFRDARGFGWDCAPPSFDWPTLRDNTKNEVARLNAVYRNLLDGADARIIEGHARIVDPRTVAVGENTYSTARILIATGGWPHIPEFPGREYAIDSNRVFDLETFPQRLVIVGGGYIAVEFAGIFNGLGASVTQLYRGPLFLRGFDADLRAHAAREIAQSGIDLRFETEVERIDAGSNGLQVTLSDGGALEADAVLYATGRRPRLQGLGLENTGVRLTHEGHVQVDAHFHTSEPGIFALGDATGGIELTPMALAEGMAFARREFGAGDASPEYDFVPSAVFCQPNIGTVGFTEEEARARCGEVDIYKSTFKPMKYSLSGRNERSLMKIIVERATNRVVGVHMVGPDAGEIMQGIAIALKAGATKSIFDQTIGIHPTAAEEFVTMREPWTED